MVTRSAKITNSTDSPHYWVLFHYSPIPMWVYSSETLSFLLVNKAAAANYGYSADEFCKMTIKDLCPVKDVPRLLETLSHPRPRLHDAGLWQIVRKDGSILDVSLFSHALQFKGQRAEAVAAIDMTDALKARRALEIQITENLEITEDMITALLKAGDLRDHYTVAHQQSVALIAVAIARKLGWDEERIRNLSWAASIHDLGKVAVPLELLIKTAKLSSLEMELVRGHVEAGYKILAGLHLPKIVPTAVLQHHERLDGSGYPRGLTSDQITIEAKILAVADVLEAIGSDRPYRSGRGLGAALQELQTNAGKLYDAEIVKVTTALADEGLLPSRRAN